MSNWLARARALSTRRDPANDATQPANPEQEAELRELVAIVLADADDTDRAEALAVALADPESALPSFRALVKQR